MVKGMIGGRSVALSFERWYNHEHKHRNLKFVSPAQRHCATDRSIFASRAALYERARKRNPARWRAAARDWVAPKVVWLNRPADDQLLGMAA
jgi:putative transposase